MEDRFENNRNRNSILPETNFQGEKFVLWTENSVGAMVELRDRVVWKCPHEQTRNQHRLKLQEHELKREQCDEEEAESNHEEQIESCPGILWEADPQSQETPHGGREELRTQP